MLEQEPARVRALAPGERGSCAGAGVGASAAQLRALERCDSGDAGNEAARGGNQAMAGDQARVGGVKVESFCAGCGNAVIVSRTQPRCSAKCQPREK
jgi:hypothetical protein